MPDLLQEGSKTARPYGQGERVLEMQDMRVHGEGE